MPERNGHASPTGPRRTDSARGRPFILPVSETDAVRWAAGSVGDLHLVLRAPLCPQAVFCGDLPDLSAYRPLLRLCAHWRRQGAYGGIYRTSNPVVAKHFEKFGARAICQEPDGRRRYVLPSEGFHRWLRRF